MRFDTTSEELTSFICSNLEPEVRLAVSATTESATNEELKLAMVTTANEMFFMAAGEGVVHEPAPPTGPTWSNKSVTPAKDGFPY